MSHSTQIRCANSLDIKSIQLLWNELISEHQASHSFFSESIDKFSHFRHHIAQQIQNRSVLILVAERQDQIIGYIHAEICNHSQKYIRNEFGYIHELIINPLYRNKGIGKSLYSKTVNWFKQHKIAHIQLEAADTNSLAKQFWFSLGFENINGQLTTEI